MSKARQPPADTPARLHSWLRRHGRWLLLGVVVLAFLLRFSAAAELKAGYSPVERPGQGSDAATYIAFAHQVLDGDYDFAGEGFYYQPLYYFLFLPAVFALPGDDIWGLILVQSLLGAATVGLIGLSFAMLFGRPAGLLAAVFLALARFHIFYTPFALIAVLQSFWLALLGYLLLLAWKRDRLWLWALAALTASAATLTRGNILLMLPVILAAVVWRYRRQRGRLVQVAALFLVLWYVPQVPFGIVNYRKHGQWKGPSSAGGAVLGLGNTPDAPPGGREPFAGEGPMAYPNIYTHWMDDEREGRRTAMSHVLAWMRAEPLAWAELKLRMFLLFWHRMEIPNNVAFGRLNPATGQFQTVPSRVLNLPILLGWGVFASLGLTGLLWAAWRQRHRPLALLMVALSLVYAGSIVLFYILARFRLPLAPWLCGFAGYAVIAALSAWRRHRAAPKGHKPRGLFAFTVLLLVSGFTVLWGYDVYRLNYEAIVMAWVRPDGTRIELDGRLTIKDHGPFAFGGWRSFPPEQAAGGPPTTKRFVLPPDAANWSPRSVRVALRGPAGGIATVAVTGADGKRHLQQVRLEPFPYHQGGTWVEIPLGDHPAPNAEDYAIEVMVVGGDAVFLYDTQRDYGRTTVAGQSVPMELVAELVLERLVRGK